MLELIHLEGEVVNAVEVHDVVLVHQGDGDGHHDVLQREKNWLKDCEISGDQVRFGRFVKLSDHREKRKKLHHSGICGEGATEENVAWSAVAVVKRG